MYVFFGEFCFYCCLEAKILEIISFFVCVRVKILYSFVILMNLNCVADDFLMCYYAHTHKHTHKHVPNSLIIAIIIPFSAHTYECTSMMPFKELTLIANIHLMRVRIRSSGRTYICFHFSISSSVQQNICS